MTIHPSKHACLAAKVSQLRSHSTSTREARSLVTEITTILGVEATAGFGLELADRDTTPMGETFVTREIQPTNLAIVPILRSGLGMVDAISNLLPHPVPIYHLGLYRDRSTLQPVEYYNNLPYHPPSPSSPSSSANTTTSPDSKPTENTAAAEMAILVDPIIATGATAEAAVYLLREWGAKKVMVLTVLGSRHGIERVQKSWPEGVDVWVGAMDGQCDEKGMIVPGLGDIGDRLFNALGK